MIGGKKKWFAGVGGTIIAAPIADFLACAGFSLDAEEAKTRSGHTEETHPPTSRITGAILSISLDYQNQDVHKQNGHPEPICKATIRVEPQWNSRASLDDMQTPSPSAGYTLIKSRYNYGLGVEVTVTGSMAFMDLMALLQGFTQFVVLWSLPGAVISFVALSGVGLLSDVYHHSAVESFKIESILAGVASRLISYSAAFHTTTHQFKGPGRSRELDQKCLKLALEGIFNSKELRSQMSDSSLEVLSKFLSRGATSLEDGAEGLSLTEFVANCGSNEPIALGTLSALLRSDRKIPIHERIFSDLPNTAYGKLMRQIQAEHAGIQSDTLHILHETHVQDEGCQSSAPAHKVHTTTHASESLGAGTYPADLEAKLATVRKEMMATLRKETRDALQSIQHTMATQSSTLPREAQQKPPDTQSLPACTQESAAVQAFYQLAGPQDSVDLQAQLQGLRHEVALQTDHLQRLALQVAKLRKQAKPHRGCETDQDAKDKIDELQQHQVVLDDVKPCLEGVQQALVEMRSRLVEPIQSKSELEHERQHQALSIARATHIHRRVRT